MSIHNPLDDALSPSRPLASVDASPSARGPEDPPVFDLHRDLLAPARRDAACDLARVRNTITEAEDKLRALRASEARILAQVAQLDAALGNAQSTTADAGDEVPA